MRTTEYCSTQSPLTEPFPLIKWEDTYFICLKCKLKKTYNPPQQLKLDKYGIEICPECDGKLLHYDHYLFLTL